MKTTPLVGGPARIAAIALLPLLAAYASQATVCTEAPVNDIQANHRAALEGLAAGMTFGGAR